MMSIKQVILALVFTVSTMISYGQFNKQWVSGGNWPFKIDFNKMITEHELVVNQEG